MISKLLPLAVGLLLASNLCSAQFSAPNPITPRIAPAREEKALLDELLAAPHPPQVIDVDDVIEIQVYGFPAYSTPLRVAADGSLVLPFIGKVLVNHLTVQSCQVLIANELKLHEILEDPQVTVSLQTQPSHVITVSGAVVRPGTYPAFGGLTLIDYVSQAGGILEVRQSNDNVQTQGSAVVTLIRSTLPHPVSINLGHDPAQSVYSRIPIFPGDEIRVGHVGVVYAVGALKNQGAYPLKNNAPTTVLQLIAQAGGIGFEGKRGSSYLIRDDIDSGSRSLIPLDLSKILEGQAPDVPMVSNDILIVPTDHIRAALKGGGASLLASLASALIYRN